MPNGTYGGVRGRETKVGQKTFVSRPTRFHHARQVGEATRGSAWQQNGLGLSS